MKTLILVFIMVTSTPLLAAEPTSRPTEQCLNNINEAMFNLGSAPTDEENEIDFEGFLDQQGNRYTFMYYKIDGRTKTLDITGKGAIDLVIKHSVVDQGLTDIDDCEVSNPQILEETRDSQKEEDQDDN